MVRKSGRQIRKQKARPRKTSLPKNKSTIGPAPLDKFGIRFKVLSIFEEDVVPFPVRGTVLFDSRDDLSNAFVERDWEAYVRGYIQAANILVEYVGQSGMDSDTLVLPITFLFRQHLELRIKSLLTDTRKLLNQPQQTRKSHDIKHLWEECRPLVEQIFPEQFSEQLDVVAQIVSQFSEIDPASQGFRYPINVTGKQSFPEGFDNINLGHLARTINGIAAFLNDIQFKLSFRLANKASK